MASGNSKDKAGNDSSDGTKGGNDNLRTSVNSAAAAASQDNPLEDAKLKANLKAREDNESKLAKDAAVLLSVLEKEVDLLGGGTGSVLRVSEHWCLTLEATDWDCMRGGSLP